DFLYIRTLRPPLSTLFPYTTLFRSIPRGKSWSDLQGNSRWSSSSSCPPESRRACKANRNHQQGTGEGSRLPVSARFRYSHRPPTPQTRHGFKRRASGGFRGGRRGASRVVAMDSYG